jgi:hypothetical protein
MSKLDMEVEIMRAAGIEDEEIVRLAGLRQRVASGDCSEVTLEHKRLAFYKYLVDNNRLSDGTPEPGEAPAAEEVTEAA